MKTATEEIINAMQVILDNIDPVNIKLQKIQMNRLFDLYADYTALIPSTKPSNEVKDPKIGLIKMEPKSKTSLDTVNQIIIGYLNRDLLGGTVFVDGCRVKVREKVCREMNLVHGDLLRIHYKDHQSILVSKLEDSKSEHESCRELLPFCIVSDQSVDDELVVVSQYINGAISKIPILVEHNFEFRITDFDRDKYSLRVGDLVDIAYHKDYPKTFKIVWKHPQEDSSFKTMSM